MKKIVFMVLVAFSSVSFGFAASAIEIKNPAGAVAAKQPGLLEPSEAVFGNPHVIYCYEQTGKTYKYCQDCLNSGKTTQQCINEANEANDTQTSASATSGR